MAAAQPIPTVAPRVTDVSAQAQAAELLRWCSERLEALVADVERLHDPAPDNADGARLERRRREAITKLRNATRVMQEKLELAERAIAEVPVAQHGLVLAAMELRTTITAAIDVARDDRLRVSS